MKRKRHSLILKLIEENPISTQEELLEYLCSHDFDVTQATVSRDIKELRLIKITDENGRYRYDNKQSVGITFSSENGLPFFVQANYFEGVGKIIHGAIKTDEHEVEKFIILYKNGEQQEIIAKNNTFITEYPKTITTSIEMFQTEIKNVIGYDTHGEIVESYN